MDPEPNLQIDDSFLVAQCNEHGLATIKPSDSNASVPKTQFALAYTGLLFAVFLYYLDSTIISPAFPFILADLGKETLLPWLGLYMLTSAPFGILYGKFSTVFPKKYVFLFALTVFLIGSMICAVAQSMEVLIFGRALAGVGGGGFLPLSFIIIADMTTLQDRSKYNSILGSAMGLGSILGPLLGGTFSDRLNWRWCFWINIPIGLISFAFIMTNLKISTTQENVLAKLRNVDVLGALTLLITLLAFNIPILLGGTTWAWDSAQVITLFVLSVLGGLVFLWIEFRVASDPIIPPAIFKVRWITASIALSFCMGAVMNSYLFYFSLLLEFIFEFSAVKTGEINVISCGTYVVFTVVSGAILAKRGHYISFFIVGPILWAISIIWVANFTKDTDMGQIVGSLLFLGTAGGLMITTRISAMQLHVPTHFLPICQGIVSCCFAVGANVAISITGTILNNLLVIKTNDSAELHTAIDMLIKEGFQVTVSQYITLAKTFQKLLQSSGSEETLFSAALIQLKSGWNDAFKYAYMSNLAYLVGILLLVPVIWPKRKEAKNEA
ncbi:MFS general substrate transporter [Rhizoclosmatium globosum]|uniref:MFS general substrate transporter n=1 Tax=Rhizoclosmatium globosum TaxID=329046 RepID=A0A1Y2BS06_9FUNG|nr:MFS general substrate transporter [Rhizoclosmatium globosum]|eukprot:ORY36915.1 MFS general substrate transporter [Rhizoclosmatium globosum]